MKLAPGDRQRVQVALTSLGFDTRGIDGALGLRSRQMIAEWQKTRGQPATGFLTAPQQQALLREGAPALQKYDEAMKKADEEKEGRCGAQATRSVIRNTAGTSQRERGRCHVPGHLRPSHRVFERDFLPLWSDDRALRRSAMIDDGLKVGTGGMLAYIGARLFCGLTSTRWIVSLLIAGSLPANASAQDAWNFSTEVPCATTPVQGLPFQKCLISNVRTFRVGTVQAWRLTFTDAKSEICSRLLQNGRSARRRRHEPGFVFGHGRLGAHSGCPEAHNVWRNRLGKRRGLERSLCDLSKGPASVHCVRAQRTGG